MFFFGIINYSIVICWRKLDLIRHTTDRRPTPENTNRTDWPFGMEQKGKMEEKTTVKNENDMH